MRCIRGVLITVAALLLFLSGCVSLDRSRMNDDEGDEKPWNEPAGWENSIPGAPSQ